MIGRRVRNGIATGVAVAVVPWVILVAVATHQLIVVLFGAVGLLAAVVAYPIVRLGDWVANQLVGVSDAPIRLRQVAEGLAIGCALPLGSVEVTDATFPNVYAIPTSS